MIGSNTVADYMGIHRYMDGLGQVSLVWPAKTVLLSINVACFALEHPTSLHRHLLFNKIQNRLTVDTKILPNMYVHPSYESKCILCTYVFSLVYSSLTF